MIDEELQHSNITRDVIFSGLKVYEAMRRTNPTIAQIQRAIKWEIEQKGRQVSKNLTIRPTYEGQKIGDEDIIHLVVDGKVGVYITTAKKITESQRMRQRGRLKFAKLEVGLVISMNGASFQWKRADVD